MDKFIFLPQHIVLKKIIPDFAKRRKRGPIFRSLAVTDYHAA